MHLRSVPQRTLTEECTVHDQLTEKCTVRDQVTEECLVGDQFTEECTVDDQLLVNKQNKFPTKWLFID